MTHNKYMYQIILDNWRSHIPFMNRYSIVTVPEGESLLYISRLLIKKIVYHTRSMNITIPKESDPIWIGKRNWFSFFQYLINGKKMELNKPIRDILINLGIYHKYNIDITIVLYIQAIKTYIDKDIYLSNINYYLELYSLWKHQFPKEIIWYISSFI